MSLLDEYDAAIDWMERIAGPIPEQSRLRMYPHVMANFAACHPSGMVTYLAPRDEAEHANFLAALPDIADVIRIQKSLRACQDDPVLQLKLRQLFSGPVFAEQEALDGAAGSARNVQHELTAAARFAGGGFRVSFEQEDFVARGYDRVFVVECKRLRSQKKLDKNLRESVSQLRRSKVTGPTVYSMAFIRLFHPAEVGSAVNIHGKARESTKSQLDGVLKDNKHAILARAAHKVDAVVLIAEIANARFEPDLGWMLGSYCNHLMLNVGTRFNAAEAEHLGSYIADDYSVEGKG